MCTHIVSDTGRLDSSLEDCHWGRGTKGVVVGMEGMVMGTGLEGMADVDVPAAWVIGGINIVKKLW